MQRQALSSAAMKLKGSLKHRVWKQRLANMFLQAIWFSLCFDRSFCNGNEEAQAAAVMAGTRVCCCLLLPCAVYHYFDHIYSKQGYYMLSA
jgi:hypothetical protein